MEPIVFGINVRGKNKDNNNRVTSNVNNNNVASGLLYQLLSRSKSQTSILSSKMNNTDTILVIPSRATIPTAKKSGAKKANQTNGTVIKVTKTVVTTTETKTGKISESKKPSRPRQKRKREDITPKKGASNNKTGDGSKILIGTGSGTITFEIQPDAEKKLVKSQTKANKQKMGAIMRIEVK